MDEISRGLDEVALGSSENNNVLQSLEEAGRHTAVEACGCAELERNDSVGAITTPLHRCKGRHHLPIIGEEMQGDQLHRTGKPDSKETEPGLKDSDVHQDLKLLQDGSGQDLQTQNSEQTTSEERPEQRCGRCHGLDCQTTSEESCLAQESCQSTLEENLDKTDQKVDQIPQEENSV